MSNVIHTTATSKGVDTEWDIFDDTGARVYQNLPGFQVTTQSYLYSCTVPAALLAGNYIFVVTRTNDAYLASGTFIWNGTDVVSVADVLNDLSASIKPEIF